jgi:hypothetical protein
MMTILSHTHSGKRTKQKAVGNRLIIQTSSTASRQCHICFERFLMKI